jgi:hypothetical protein
MWAITAGSGWSAEPNAPAVVLVSDKVLASDIEPLGLNTGPLSGGTNCATNQLFPNPGFEPIVLREIQRVTATGPGWFEFDNMTYYELRGPGFGNGARVRFFRLVDEQARREGIRPVCAAHDRRNGHADSGVEAIRPGPEDQMGAGRELLD